MKKQLLILLLLFSVALLYGQQTVIYGTTSIGSPSKGNNGNIFSYNLTTGRDSTMVFFNGANGSLPYGDLVADIASNMLYGTTRGGGSASVGVLYAYNPFSNQIQVLVNFNGADGSLPGRGRLTLYNGKLYGMTNSGGTNNYGVIYSYDLSSDTYTVLQNFGGAAGSPSTPFNMTLTPYNGLFYGTTGAGGKYDSGTIFSFNPVSGKDSLLYSFDSNGHGASSALVYDGNNGLFYGLSYKGGIYNRGVLFSYNAVSNTEYTVINFDSTNGMYPVASLVYDSLNNMLYGATENGDSINTGLIFKFNPNSNSIVASYNIGAGINGTYINAPLLLGSDGAIYGLASSGGASDAGTFFSIDTASAAPSVIVTFNDVNGEQPQGGMVTVDYSGTISGITYIDKNHDCVYDSGDAPISGVSLNVINNGNHIATVTTDANGQYSCYLRQGATYTIELDSSATPLQVQCNALGTLTVNSTTSSANFALYDSAMLYTDSVRYSITRACYNDSAEMFGFSVWGHFSKVPAGDTVMLKFYFGDGSYIASPVVSTGSMQAVTDTFSHAYTHSGNYDCRFYLQRPFGFADSLTDSLKANVTCGMITGILYNDNNYDCTYDYGDNPVPNTTVKAIYNDTLVAIATSDSTGRYVLAPLTPGKTYTIEMDSTVNTWNTVQCPVTGKVIASATSVTGNDIAIACHQGFDLSCAVEGCLISGDSNNTLTAFMFNNRCQAVNGSLTMIVDTAIHIGWVTGDSTTYISADNDTVIWNFSQVGAPGAYAYNLINAYVDSLAAGDSVKITLIANPIIGDSVPLNNTMVYWIKVNPDSCVGYPYDPNGKEVTPNGKISDTQLLTYNIHFQNTGTAPAKNVVVIDSLNQYLDISTLKVNSSSSPMTTEILPGHVLKFTFTNINLPDTATSKTASIGSFSYHIMPLAGLVSGTVITNDAGIYFDSNPVIETNTTVNIIDNNIVNGVNPITMSNNGNVIVYPNPSTGIFNCELQNTNYGSCNIEVYNILGQQVFNQENVISNSSFVINLSGQPKGIYFYRLLNKNGELVSSGKLILQ